MTEENVIILALLHDICKTYFYTTEIRLSKTYPWADGWFAGGMTSNREVTADVVYAGFGVTAPELGYDAVSYTHLPHILHRNSQFLNAGHQFVIISLTFRTTYYFANLRE